MVALDLSLEHVFPKAVIGRYGANLPGSILDLPPRSTTWIYILDLPPALFPDIPADLLWIHPWMHSWVALFMFELRMDL